MTAALKEAEKAYFLDEVPVGAVILHNNKIITATHNLVITNQNPSAHAEILAIEKACSILGSNYLNECDIYITLEPCAMCAQALALSKIRAIYFGVYDEKFGAVRSNLNIFKDIRANWEPEIYSGIMEEECKSLLRKFFKEKRHN